MTPEQYEALTGSVVRDISSSLSDMADAELHYGRTNKINGASGFKHQVDVSLTSASWLVLVECKRWLKKIGVQEVLVLASRSADIKEKEPGKKLWVSMVTQKGASGNAQTLARHFDINIDVVRSASEFSVRLRSRVGMGFQAGAALTTELEMEVIKAQQRRS
jgi:hypothetical protein